MIFVCRYTAHDIQLTGPCTIERRAASTLSPTEFLSEYVKEVNGDLLNLFLLC